MSRSYLSWSGRGGATTPSARQRMLRGIFFVAQPPLLGEEGKTARFNSFTPLYTAPSEVHLCGQLKLTRIAREHGIPLGKRRIARSEVIGLARVLKCVDAVDSPRRVLRMVERIVHVDSKLDLVVLFK